MRCLIQVSLILAAVPFSAVDAQTRQPTPIVQSDLTVESATVRPLTIRDASRNSRWLGLGVRDVRWAPDGSVVYFRWNERPGSNDLPDADPWYRTDRDGAWVERVPELDILDIPSATVAWSVDGKRATWTSDGAVFLYDGTETRRVVALDGNAQRARFVDDGSTIHFEIGEALYSYAIDAGTLSLLAVRVEPDRDDATEAGAWLAEQQRELFDHVRTQDALREQGEALRLVRAHGPQAIPVPRGRTVDNIRVSPDGKFLTFRARTRAQQRPSTQYIDYVDVSGYAEVRNARSKVGEPRDVVMMGVVPFDPYVEVEQIDVQWFELPEAGDEHTMPHGPYWNLEGTRAVAQFIGENDHDLWIAELDLTTGQTNVLLHDHDDAWLGGPPIQTNYLQPTLLEWLPDDRFVFASERSGWSHLYRMDPDGSITALTSGDWEVRAAVLTPDRSTWLLKASREHPAEDHLYTMPASGGDLTRITHEQGGHDGWWAPDGDCIAVVYDETVQLPDLWVRNLSPSDVGERVTVSGADAYFEHPLVRPEIVSFPHPDGDPLWAAVFSPETPNAERAAVVHVHGGGYRQFAHRGWTVYGWAQHLGLINYLVQQGYTVLDFDYRGSAGFGRDYRTDIARSMGIKDADGAVAAAHYLVDERGIDPARIGIFGVSYGGFMTLMAQFRYPGVFAAGIARAAVTDWAHYSDQWTSRILGVPHEDPEAYELSSPIYYADGLEDALLITHGLVDGNVQFQDAARLVQRLIELEKDFEIMVYPVEPHTIQTEPSRYDYMKRAMVFFDEHLRARP